MPIAGLATNIVALVITILWWVVIGVAIVEESSSTAPSELVPQQTFAEMKVDAGTIDYEELFRHAEKYEGQKFYFEGHDSAVDGPAIQQCPGHAG